MNCAGTYELLSENRVVSWTENNVIIKGSTEVKLTKIILNYLFIYIWAVERKPR